MIVGKTFKDGIMRAVNAAGLRITKHNNCENVSWKYLCFTTVFAWKFIGRRVSEENPAFSTRSRFGLRKRDR